MRLATWRGFFFSVYTVRVMLTQTEPGLCSSSEPHNRSFERSHGGSVEGHWLSLCTCQEDAGERWCEFIQVKNTWSQDTRGQLKNRRKQQGSGASYRKADVYRQTHTPTTGFSYIFFKKGFIYRILNFAIKFDPFGAKPDLFRDLGPLAGPLCTLEFLLQNVSCHRNP